jgi:uncharacterized membrane protein
MLRFFLGVLLTTFLPGFALTFVIFRLKEINWPERIAKMLPIISARVKANIQLIHLNRRLQTRGFQGTRLVLAWKTLQINKKLQEL